MNTAARKHVVTTVLLMLVAAIVGLATPAGAQGELPSGVPEGTECVTFALDPPELTAAVPGPNDLTVILLEDGTEVAFENTTDGQVVSSPSDSPIVFIWKCQLPEAPEEEAPEEEAPEGEESPEGEETSPPQAQEDEAPAEEEELAETGGESAPMVVAGITLVAAGALLVAGTRRLRLS